jgi:probable phosphoglycerate mutase
MHIYFCRHGESEANVLHEFSNRGLKHGLTVRGQRQAAALARRLSAISFSRFYASPLLRAVETAQVLAATLGLKYEQAGALREFDCGILEGRSDQASWDLYQVIVHDWLLKGRWERRFEGGESFVDIKERFVPFVQWLVDRHRRTPDNILLLGHGGLFHCMLPLLLDNVDAEFALDRPLPQAGVVVAGVMSGGLVCTDWCGIELDSG